ncbi:MAG: RsiV family protein [Saprospiraceae bacterium]
MLFRLFLCGALVCGAAFFVLSCGDSSSSLSPVVIGESRFERSGGPDCDLPDTLQYKCARIELEWPVLESGSETLKANFAKWAESYLVSMLTIGESADAVREIEPAAALFLSAHDEFLREREEGVMGNWAVDAGYNILLNDGAHLSAQINAYTYAGGAHGLGGAQIASFDTRTGKQLDWEDLVADQSALRNLAEKAFRKERADAFAEGFDFDETFVFDLPQNFGLTEQGILFYYNPYEIGPYAMGATEFVIPFEELGDLAKIKKGK